MQEVMAVSDGEMRTRVAGAYADAFGAPATRSGFAPGRVNLIGEHLDYNGGPCLPIALRHGTWVALEESEGTLVRLVSGSQHAEVPLTASGEGAWTDYVTGMLSTPMNVAIESTVPIGAGLSSSAALVCSVGAALGLADEDLVQAGIRAEREQVGAPTGGLDQTVAVYGTRDHALLIDFGSGARRSVPYAPIGHTLLVIDTLVSHQLSAGDGGYAQRRAECEEAAAALGVDLLAQATSWKGVGGTPGRRARHVITETARVHAAVDALESGDWTRFGDLMLESHASMREDFEISTPELDAIVDTARSAGALGARMTGGGFGGAAIALVPDALAGDVIAEVGAEFARRGWREPRWLRAEAGPGARTLG